MKRGIIVLLSFVTGTGFGFLSNWYISTYKTSVLPTDAFEELLSASEIKSIYGVEVAHIGVCDSFQLNGSGRFLTVSRRRVPYFVYPGAAGGLSLGVLDLNSPGANGHYYTYDHLEFLKRHGLKINGVKFTTLRQPVNTNSAAGAKLQ